MKDIIELRIENKRLKKEVSELENRIANLDKWYHENLKNLWIELVATLRVLNNDKA